MQEHGMKIYRHASFSIFFGTQKERCDPSLYRAFANSELLCHYPFKYIQEAVSATDLFFLHQVHGTDGFVVHDVNLSDSFASFSNDGDYLITQHVRHALGVITADCLPIIFYDTKHHVVAIAHAGWRGSVLGIALKVLNNLCVLYATDPVDVLVFFGPSARVCCYRVDEKFIEPLRSFSNFDQVIQQRQSEYFFDVPLYNALLLTQNGVKQESINRDYNFCTLCTDGYCSHRRDPQQPFRNVTAVTLY